MRCGWHVFILVTLTYIMLYILSDVFVLLGFCCKNFRIFRTFFRIFSATVVGEMFFCTINATGAIKFAYSVVTNH